MDEATRLALERECAEWNTTKRPTAQLSHGGDMLNAHVRAYAGLGMSVLPKGGAGGKIRKEKKSRNIRKKASRIVLFFGKAE